MDKKTTGSSSGTIPKTDFTLSTATTAMPDHKLSGTTTNSSTNDDITTRASSDKSFSKNISSSIEGSDIRSGNLNMDLQKTTNFSDDSSDQVALSEKMTKLKLNDMNVIGTEIETGNLRTSDTSSSNRRISDSEQGTLNVTTTSTTCNYHNPVLTITTTITNTFAHSLSKSLSQSSSTATLSSSSTSSVLIDSPSSLCPIVTPLSNQQLTQSPPKPPPPPPLHQHCSVKKSAQPPTLTSSSRSLSLSPSSSLTHKSSLPHIRHLPKTHSLDLGDDPPGIDNDDIDADIDEDEDLPIKRRTPKTPALSLLPIRMPISSARTAIAGSAISQDQKLYRNASDVVAARHYRIMQSQSQTEILPPGPGAKGMIPKLQSLESRPIYPNVPYSPYGSPYGSPRSNRRRAPLRESRRVSIEQSGSFLQLNQYKLMDQIGQGSYGLVKLAYSEEDSTHYAMKILSKRKLLRKAGLMGRGPKKTTSPLDRVYREIAVLKKLDHPNVVKLVEVLDDPLEDSLYLVFELVQQGEVLSIPTEHPLSEERAWCVFRDALQGLEYLHYQRIIHADIKPGNLLLGEYGRVKIADLGVCNEFFGEDAAMNNGSTAGTPAFRAPETLIPGQHMYSGKAADIWAVGATLYALVYGNVPFLATSVPAVYEKIKHDDLSFPENPKISPELRDLIEKILMKDPAKRLTLPQIKEHPWVSANGDCPLPSEEENCRLVQINDEDISTVVKSIPKLDTLILIKTMLKNHSFQHPFSRGSISGRAPQRGGSRLERFTRAGRSNSAPGAYHLSDRQLSNESILPAVSESVPSSSNDSTDLSLDC